MSRHADRRESLYKLITVIIITDSSYLDHSIRLLVRVFVAFRIIHQVSPIQQPAYDNQDVPTVDRIVVTYPNRQDHCKYQPYVYKVQDDAVLVELPRNFR